MEKFGIFELLDTLSAFTSMKAEQSADEQPNLPVKQTASPPQKEERAPSGAFASLLARQEEISKRIDGKK